MPKIKLTKSVIDALEPTSTDEVYWDAALPGFGVKVTPKGRRVFIALYRVRGGKSRLRKYTIGPYGKLTLHHARATAQRVFAERFEGRDPAAEKLEQRRREVADRVDDLIEAFAAEHLSGIRSGKAIARALRREVIPVWGHRSIHDIKRRDISSLVFQVAAQRTPNSAHRLLKGIKRFSSWCLGRAILESSPALGIQSGYREVSRDRVLNDEELAKVIQAARKIGGPFGGIVEFLALTGQRREEVNQMVWDEIDLERRLWTLPAARAKNGRLHVVHLSEQAVAILNHPDRGQTYSFSKTARPYQRFNKMKRRLYAMTGIDDGSFMTCVGRVCPEWRDWVWHHMSRTRSSITRRERSRGWRRSISGTSF